MTVFLGPLGGPESHQSTAAMTGVGPLPPPGAHLLAGWVRPFEWRLGPVSWAFLSPVFRGPTVKTGSLSWQRFIESTFGVTRSWVWCCHDAPKRLVLPFSLCSSFLSALAWYLLLKTLTKHVNKRAERSLGFPGKLLTFPITSRVDWLKKWVQIQCAPWKCLGPHSYVFW